MIKVILTLFIAFDLVDTTGNAYIILNTVGDAFFYFMLIVPTYTTAKRPNSNPSLAVVMAVVLLHPNLEVLLLQGNTSYFGLPVTSASCSSSILPVLPIVPFMGWIERFVDKTCPDVVKVFLKLLAVIFASVPVALVAIGPIGTIVGNYLTDRVNLLYNKIDWLIVVMLSAIMPLIAMTGIHHALIPVCTINLASLGYDAVLITAMSCSNLAQSEAPMAVVTKTKDNIVKSIAPATGISTIAVSVTGPAMYGITSEYKTLMIAAVCGAGASGLYSGITHLVGYTMGGFPSVLAFIQMIGREGSANLPNGVITSAISLGVSFLVSLALYKSDLAETGEKEAASIEETKILPQEIKPLVERIEIKNPSDGAVIPLKEVSDPVFSDNVLEEGTAVTPPDRKVYAPVDGMIGAVMDSEYAVGTTADNQAEVLIHVGLDTVNLRGEGPNPHCKTGGRMKAGDLLLELDPGLLKEKGYDTIIPVLISDPAGFINVKTAEIKEITAGEVLLTIV